VLAAVDPALTAAQARERALLGVEVAVARGNAASAWNELAKIPQPADPAGAARWLEVRERAALASGRLAEGVAAQVAREPLLADPAAVEASRLELFGALREAIERGVRPDLRTVTNPVERGWLELAPIAAVAARNPLAAGPALGSWRVRYPAHPAAAIVRREIDQAGDAPRAADAGGHIALVLPLTGRVANAAAQVRDGFMAAHYATPAVVRPEVRVYDTGTMTVGDALARASAAGARAIVGPLTREEVAEAAATGGAGPLVLALNFLPSGAPAPPGFFQFAISPENEARLVARRLLAEGRTAGVALVPAGDWGTRVLNAFAEELRAGGGELLDVAEYEPAANDFSRPIQAVLRLDESKARHRRIESITGAKLAFQPRRRSDAQFVFAPGQPNAARQLRPQLRFFFAGDLPTYATSDAYEPNVAANQDMDGLVFPDMPWILETGARSQEVRAHLAEAFGEAGARRGKLFAFGHDAFELAQALVSSRGAAPVEVDGLTGRITLDADNRARRELEWAEMRGGRPQLLGISTPAPVAPNAE
jgi:hypothetical protein